MGPLDQKSLIQNSETHFREQLQSLSKEVPKQETILKSIVNAIKGIFCYHDSSHQRLIELKTLQLLTDGKKWIKTPEDIELVKNLAEKLGLAQSNKNHSSELLTLIHEICSPIPFQNSHLKKQNDKSEDRQDAKNDQMASTSQEDSNPHENPTKSEHITPSNKQPIHNEIKDPILLVIPESQISSEATTDVTKVTTSNEEKINRIKKFNLQNISWNAVAKTAFIATSILSTLGLIYIVYPSSSPSAVIITDSVGSSNIAVIGAISLACFVALIAAKTFNDKNGNLQQIQPTNYQTSTLKPKGLGHIFHSGKSNLPYLKQSHTGFISSSKQDEIVNTKPLVEVNESQSQTTTTIQADLQKIEEDLNSVLIVGKNSLKEFLEVDKNYLADFLKFNKDLAKQYVIECTKLDTDIAQQVVTEGFNAFMEINKIDANDIAMACVDHLFPKHLAVARSGNKTIIFDACQQFRNDETKDLFLNLAKKTAESFKNVNNVEDLSLYCKYLIPNIEESEADERDSFEMINLLLGIAIHSKDYTTLKPLLADCVKCTNPKIQAFVKQALNELHDDLNEKACEIFKTLNPCYEFLTAFYTKKDDLEFDFPLFLNTYAVNEEVLVFAGSLIGNKYHKELYDKIAIEIINKSTHITSKEPSDQEINNFYRQAFLYIGQNKIESSDWIKESIEKKIDFLINNNQLEKAVIIANKCIEEKLPISLNFIGSVHNLIKPYTEIIISDKSPFIKNKQEAINNILKIADFFNYCKNQLSEMFFDHFVSPQIFELIRPFVAKTDEKNQKIVDRICYIVYPVIAEKITTLFSNINGPETEHDTHKQILQIITPFMLSKIGKKFFANFIHHSSRQAWQFAEYYIDVNDENKSKGAQDESSLSPHKKIASDYLTKRASSKSFVSVKNDDQNNSDLSQLIVNAAKDCLFQNENDPHAALFAMKSIQKINLNDYQYLASIYLKLCNKLNLKECLEEILDRRKTKKIDDASWHIALELAKQALHVHQENALLSLLEQKEDLEKKIPDALIDKQNDSDFQSELLEMKK